jgi:hypothetical protein
MGIEQVKLSGGHDPLRQKLVLPKLVEMLSPPGSEYRQCLLSKRSVYFS